MIFDEKCITYPVKGTFITLIFNKIDNNLYIIPSSPYSDDYAIDIYHGEDDDNYFEELASKVLFTIETMINENNILPVYNINSKEYREKMIDIVKKLYNMVKEKDNG